MARTSGCKLKVLEPVNQNDIEMVKTTLYAPFPPISLILSTTEMGLRMFCVSHFGPWRLFSDAKPSPYPLSPEVGENRLTVATCELTLRDRQ